MHISKGSRSPKIMSIVKHNILYITEPIYQSAVIIGLSQIVITLVMSDIKFLVKFTVSVY